MTAGELARALALELRGDPARALSRFAPLERAIDGEVTFVTGPRQRAALRASRAALVILPEPLAPDCPGDCLVSADPYASFARASWLLTPEASSLAGVHPGASVDPSARLAQGVSVGPGTSVGARCELGRGVRVGAGCAIGDGARIGDGTRLFARVTIGDGVVLGARCRVQSGAVIGAEGFGYARDASGWLPIHQTGGVTLGDRVHVGANTTIDRGTIDPTVIGDGVILDNQIQIAHNVRIGENTAIAACTGIAGSAIIGRDCLIGGSCNINGHIEIADGTTITATSFVPRSLAVRGSYGSALPLQESASWRRTFAAIGKLDGLVRRVRRLERQASGAPTRKSNEFPDADHGGHEEG